MKQITLCIACLLLSLVTVANPAYLPGSKEKVRLKGSLGTISVKSLPATEPVEVYYSDTAVEVMFNKSLGNLTITVTGKWGLTVYSNTVNATAGGSLMIPITNWNAGTYTVRITNGQGGCLEGSFEK